MSILTTVVKKDPCSSFLTSILSPTTALDVLQDVCFHLLVAILRWSQKGRFMTTVLWQLVINKFTHPYRLYPSDLNGAVFSMDVCPRKGNLASENKSVSPPFTPQARKTEAIIDFSKIYISSWRNLQLYSRVTVTYLNVQILWLKAKWSTEVNLN